MNINSWSPSNISSTIWAAASRLLTSLGTGVLTLGSAVNQTLAANTTVTFSCIAGSGQQGQITFSTGAAGPSNVTLNDGTVAGVILSVAASNNGSCQYLITGTGVAAKLNNTDATNAAHYNHSSIRWNQ